MGFPEMGDVCIPELESVYAVFEIPIERDLHINADRTISELQCDSSAAKPVNQWILHLLLRTPGAAISVQPLTNNPSANG